MYSYLLLGLVVIAVVIVSFRVRKPTRPQLYALLTLLILTIIFDNVIIGLDIVNYDNGKKLGIFIGKAPVEDLLYALLAGLLIPSLWSRMRERS